ncbi:hypothetical protein HMSSN036_40860 [Paenibacillus macerans]|nr:hypothetical protein HMSSN036_40860 [Paenibacillus macerans]
MKKTYKVMSSAALASALLLGAAWGAAETAGPAAATASAAESGGTQTAAEADGVTQNGITLAVSKAQYDGNYVSITLERSGTGYTGGINEKVYDDKTEDYIYKKGAVKSIELLIDGKPIYEYGGESMAQKPQYVWGQGSTKDMLNIKLVDPSWIDNNLKAFPDKFKLTAKVTLDGVDQPYTLTMMLQKPRAKRLP